MNNYIQYQMGDQIADPLPITTASRWGVGMNKWFYSTVYAHFAGNLIT